MIDFSTEEWRVLDRWLAEHHPNPDEEEEFFGIFEAVQEFNEWAQHNSIEKYLDRNQPNAT